MEPIKLELPPGLFRQGTQYQAAARWHEGQYMRFFEGTIRPMGGWATGLDGTLTGAPRASHAWLDDAEGATAMLATNSKLYYHNGSTLEDITPTGFAATDANAAQVTLANFGSTGIFCNDEDKTIYEMTPGGGDATEVTNSPTAEAIFVTEEKFLIALAINGDPRAFGWPDQETLTVWTATAINQAGDLPIHAVGRLMCGLSIRGSALLFTTEGLHRLEYLGPPDVYGSEHVNNGCGIIGRNAKVAVDSYAYWMGANRFFKYGGYVEPLQSTVSDDVFKNLNRAHRHKCWCEYMPETGEVWFYYPRGAATECSHAAIYNHVEGHWNHTPMARVAGFASDVFDYPIRVTSAGAMLKHEFGWDYDDAMRNLISGPMELGSGGRLMYVDEIMPDEITQGDCAVYIYLRDAPNATETTLGPFVAQDRMPIEVAARQIRIELRAAEDVEDFRIGTYRAEGVRSRGRHG